ncbi:MAG: hypothetical protein PSN46_03950 [Gammaproteobacteria bacterium]|nr:hypothetical protein [Gammaproteobacteria bacterium]
MRRMLITLLAVGLLLLSVGKSYASVDVPVSNAGHEVMVMAAGTMAMAETCEDMGAKGDGLFSHFSCHLNMTSLITGYHVVGLTGLPLPDYNYQFSSTVHIQPLFTQPPQLA